jgi:hypothetical protein
MLNEIFRAAVMKSIEAGDGMVVIEGKAMSGAKWLGPPLKPQ